MNPQNGIIGDDFGTSLPELVVNEDSLKVERNMARFSKTAEFKKLKELLEDRIAFYKTHLPDGRPIVGTTPDELAQMWPIANAIIGEFQAILNAYQLANDAVEEHDRA